MKHTINIEKIVHGGLGLGRLESGIVTLTPFVAPGEKVVIRELQKHRGYSVSEPVTILEPSPELVEPQCPWYFHCGGCNLQHLSRWI